MRVKLLLPLILLITALPLAAKATTDWSQCSTPVLIAQQPVNYDQAATEIEADQVFSTDENLLEFSGQVQLRRQTQSIQADTLYFYKNPQRVEARGNLSFTDDLYSLQAERLEFHNNLNQGLFSQVSFTLYESHLRGTAGRIQQLQNGLSELQDVTYTTCDPGQNSWSLSASKLEFDQQQGIGTAHHAVLRVIDVPVFYFPWFRFPITDQRMSGVLTPTFSHSNLDGTVVAVPIYWNQAANYDMTFTPVAYSQRGLQLNTENRYLFGSHLGQLHLSWLDDDDFEDERWYRQWRHEAGSDDGIRTSILLQKVSDSEFLDDFDHQETISDVDFLQSTVSFSTTLNNWDARLQFEEYQTINEQKSIASRPYKRLPQLTLEREFSAQQGLFKTDWNNEWVSFDRAQSITGERLHIAPRMTLDLHSDAYFLRPSLQLDFTEYRLDNNLDDNNAISRSIPLLSLDSGLIFERLAGTSGGWIHTLEPRLYLLHVPYQEQSDIPDFDSALLSESYDNLFINNRFSGGDRIGDSQQASVGLTTRILNAESGGEIFSASIGQAYYDKPRKVSLNNSVDEREKSSLIGNLTYKPKPEWDIQLTSVYDQLEKESAQTDFSLRRQHQRQAFNLEYHMRRDKLEQSTLSFVYPMSTYWTVFAKRQHSILRDKPVQNLFGLAYESCCWAFQVLYEESSDKNFEETDRTVFFELTLKGLSSAGKDIDSLLEEGIVGYRPKF